MQSSASSWVGGSTTAEGPTAKARARRWGVGSPTAATWALMTERLGSSCTPRWREQGSPSAEVPCGRRGQHASGQQSGAVGARRARVRSQTRLPPLPAERLTPPLVLAPLPRSRPPRTHPHCVLQQALQPMRGEGAQRGGMRVERRHKRICPVTSAHEEKAARGGGQRDRRGESRPRTATAAAGSAGGGSRGRGSGQPWLQQHASTRPLAPASPPHCFQVIQQV